MALDRSHFSVCFLFRTSGYISHSQAGSTRWHEIPEAQNKKKDRKRALNMSQQICVQWNDFKGNVKNVFGRLRDDKEFADVTLACEDGQQMEAHKVILAASSPFFEKMLTKNKHPRPLIYFKGIHAQDLMAILDFLYFGEANIFQENLDSFLAFAEQLNLEGLVGPSSSDMFEEEKYENPKPVNKVKESCSIETTYKDDINSDQLLNVPIKLQNVPRTLPNVSGTLQNVSGTVPISDDLRALDEKVKSMMEKSQNMISNGRKADGTSLQTRASICKVCGKEDKAINLVGHIESNHLVGISIPCDCCDKTFGTRQNLRIHKSKYHR